MADVIRQKDGRRWSVNSGGIQTLRRKYTVEIDGNNLGADAEAVSFSGVPAIGSAHPNYSGLKVKTYDVEEGEGNEKKLLTVWVNYDTEVDETIGEGQDAVSAAVEEWGWDDGMDERELVTAVNGVALVNSAGDPFDSVPRISTPAPVFTKVIKFENQQSGWASSFCTINSSALTIGGIQCAKWTLLCTVCEKMIFGDPKYRYRYTIRLRYRSNLVKLYGSGNAQEIGWNVSITDSGMRELIADGKKVLIRARDAETGRMCAVTSPELLNGEGHALSRANGQTPVPYNAFFKAYNESSFPGWFYSKPT